ncbi:MAG: hypothetical protein A2151_00925 [Candidatus Muproteobacteria bacterium RBG_16_65_34]|uniref:Uncharacterized protein n=1 Tax=Candidatus Muproteobacteria bacterium RBG_16_65_34 TaxID=1817760 RepID=A0A1F6TNW3_9PROT|nr:MAG: hypothetical protein A2151_00925 [Candidatus Muproteobacteria bacterium RBG_16_65_34]
MNFKELLEKLEHRLGNHQLPLNPCARGIKDIFEGSPLHPDLMTKLVRAIFSGNTCRSLTDPVNRAATFRALAPPRLEALRAATTDVDAHRLLGELCAALEEIFADPAQAAAPSTRGQPKSPAEVIPFPSVRRGRFRTSA